MIYQDVYSQIKPVDMFGAIQDVKQAQALEQQRQNTLAEQARAAARKGQEDIVYKGQLATQALIGFKKLSAQQKPAQWNSYRQRIESLIPEAKGSLPSVWDSNDPANEAELDKLIGGWSSTFFQPEQVKLGAEETLLQVQPGVGPVEIARGMGKPQKSIFGEEKVSLPDGSQMMVDTVDLPSGSRVVGDIVKDSRQYGKKIPVAEYFQLYPEDWPAGVAKPPVVPETQNALGRPPVAPKAVPGQTELPPMQFNAPSSTNRAGETNVGYPIDMSMAAPGQPTNALAAMNVPAGGMAPPVVPSMGGNALFGGMGMALPVNPQQLAESMNMLAQDQDQFAQVPNTLENVVRGDVNQAATGGYKQEVVPGGIRFSGPQKPSEGKDRFRPATPQEKISAGLNPEIDAAQFNETTGQIVPIPRGNVEQQKILEIQLAEARAAQGKSAAERSKAETEAKVKREELDKIRSNKTSALKNIIAIEDKLYDLVGSEFVDTGPIDFLAKYTPTKKGAKLRALDEAVKTAHNSIQGAVRVAGTGDMNAKEVEFAIGMFPSSDVDLPVNLERIASLRDRFMDYVGVQAIVRTPADFDKLPVGTIFFDAKTGKKAKKVKM